MATYYRYIMPQLNWYWNWFISTIKQDILQITCRLLDQSEAACSKQLPLKVNIPRSPNIAYMSGPHTEIVAVIFLSLELGMFLHLHF